MDDNRKKNQFQEMKGKFTFHILSFTLAKYLQFYVLVNLNNASFEKIGIQFFICLFETKIDLLGDLTAKNFEVAIPL